ncbi:MAG: SPOR domain-containing protein [Paracoccaceae bacterium]
MITTTIARRRALLAGTALAFLAGCGGDGLRLPQMPGLGGGTAPDTEVAASRAIARDVEAPEIFQSRARAVWTGEPSLTGVWVASAEVDEPGRAIIRDVRSDRFVVGSLFYRATIQGAPPLIVSEEAAAALGMQAGQQATLDVVALRRAEGADVAVPDAPPAEAIPLPTGAPADGPTDATVTAPGPMPPVTSASVTPASGAPVPSATGPRLGTGLLDPLGDLSLAPGPAIGLPQAPVPAAAPARPWVQIGLFAQRGNADASAERLRAQGLPVSIETGAGGGRPLYRVIVGPAASAAARDANLAAARGAGFADAYLVAD